MLVNKRTISSFFPYKDKLPIELRSSLVYQFSCETCSHRYIGSTYRNLYIRVHEHSGRSPRTGKLISCPSNSSILDHSIICNTKVDISKFKILNQISCKFSLRILESMYIHKEKPELNDMFSATPLLVVR